MSIELVTPQEKQRQIAQAARAKRLSYNLSQLSLSEKSGVSYGVIKKFERTGQISLNSLLKIALALGAMKDFNGLFAATSPEETRSLDELLAQSSRQRGRK